MTMEMTTTENMTTEKTATEERTVDMRMVPRGYQYCFQEKCPMRKSCLRWIAGQHVDPAVTWGPAVYPTARKEKECSFYQKAEMQVMAWGLNYRIVDFTQFLLQINSILLKQLNKNARNQ